VLSTSTISGELRILAITGRKKEFRQPLP